MQPARSISAIQRERTQRIALGLLLLGSFFLVLRLAAPLWIGLAFGTLGALSLQPVYLSVLARTGGRKSLAAVLTTLLGAAGFTAPCVAVFYVLTGELVSLVALLQSQLNSESLLRYVGAAHSPLAERLGFSREVILPRLDRLLDTAMSYASTVAAFAVQTLTSTLLAMVIGLMTLYAVLLRWPQLTLRLERILPLERRHTRAVLSEFARVGRVTLTGTFATALVQGALAILGYVLTQTPHALAWGLLTAASTLVPLIGTAVVWIPVSAYLLLAGHQFLAIVNLAWGLLVVSFIGDYVIRPRLVGHQRGGSSLVVIVSILGGVEMFGVPGLVMGPILMSLFFRHSHDLRTRPRRGSGERARVWQKCEPRQFASRFATRISPGNPVRALRQGRSLGRSHREIS